jgi:SpoVK/Ycf46/Vps4 family AAA+-type ATPase
MAAKRKLEVFDPNKSDSDDLDYGADSPPPRSRPQARSRKTQRGSPRKRAKRPRDTYDDSDIERDSVTASEEEASFSESEIEEAVEKHPRTGRSVRSVAKKPVKYEESEEDEEIAATDSEIDLSQPTPARNKQERRAALSKPSLWVTLKLPVGMDHGRATRAATGSRPSRRAPTPQAVQNGASTRKSSRLSHDEDKPLVALTDSGKHEIVTRASATPEPSTARRQTRGGKGLKKPPSAILEASQEGSVVDVQPTAEGEDFFATLQEAAATTEVEKEVSRTSPESTAKDDDIRMDYGEDEDAEKVVQESQQDAEDAEEDEGPIAKSGRQLRNRRKASTPPASQPVSGTRRKLRNRKHGVEQSSDFEPDAEGEVDADQEVSDSDDEHKPGRGRNSSNEASSQGRRSGRLRKSASQRSRSRRQASAEDEELDPEEIADEAAELDEDNRRNRRSRKTRPAPRPTEINFEPTLRSRGNRPDYRILRPELLLPIEEDDAPAMAAPTPQRNRRGGGGPAYRSLFSTFGPFGGAGGPPPVLGGPEGQGAIGGVDSDSSDDEGLAKGGQQGVGGTVGMTPTAGFPKPFQPAPQALNNEPLAGPGGGPPGLGKVKDRKALADADPLGVDPNVSFDGVGGLDNHINQLKEMVALPLLYPEVFQRFHVTPPRGVLFHGPPGTGKTLLARALASSVSSQGRKVTFYMRKGADALSKWVGEAEKQLRLLFEEARKNQPSIIFFDEIDGLAPVRSSKQEQIHASIVATLLALMDGMDGRGQVIVIGATNRPDSVDPALRRPGRFDREFYFPLPDVDGRRKIIDIHTKGWDPPLKPEFKDQLAELTRGYGGADLRALCTEAALNAVQGTYPQIYSSDEKLIIDPSTIKVLAKDFMISVNKIVPSSERSASSGAAPLNKAIEPLLRQPLEQITTLIDEAIPRKRKVTALEEAMYDDRDDEFGFQKETMQRDFEAGRIFRPRLLVRGLQGMGQQYLGAALLSKFEGLHVQNFDMASLMKDSTRVSHSRACT